MNNYKFKIIIITQGVSRIVLPLVKHCNVVGIIESAPRTVPTKYGLFFGILKKYIFFYFRRKGLLSFSKSKNIPYYYMNKGSDINLENWIKSKCPDLIIVYSMSQLLKKNIYMIPKYKTLNLHPSYLPKYRGPNPWFWMYYNMDKRGGVTLHFIDDYEDTGDIVYQEEFDIPLGIKSPEMQDLAISDIGVRLILKAIDNVQNLPRKKQPHLSTTDRAKNIPRSDHLNIINWNQFNIERIWHILRGTEMWLQAIKNNEKIYANYCISIGHYEKCEMKNYLIGEINFENGNYFIACRDGKIFISLRFKFLKYLKNVIMKK